MAAPCAYPEPQALDRSQAAYWDSERLMRACNAATTEGRYDDAGRLWCEATAAALATLPPATSLEGVFRAYGDTDMLGLVEEAQAALGASLVRWGDDGLPIMGEG